eukprot:12939107-Prorocentrum_lima.AAC.1
MLIPKSDVRHTGGTRVVGLRRRWSHVYVDFRRDCSHMEYAESKRDGGHTSMSITKSDRGHTSMSM